MVTNKIHKSQISYASDFDEFDKNIRQIDKNIESNLHCKNMFVKIAIQYANHLNISLSRKIKKKLLYL